MGRHKGQANQGKLKMGQLKKGPPKPSAKESRDAIKAAARLDHILAAGEREIAAAVPINQALLESVKHEYQHALEAIHRQVALTGVAKARKEEAKLTQLFEEFAAAIGARKDAMAEKKAREIHELATHLVRVSEKHDHREKKELKKLVADRDNDQSLLAGSSQRLKASPELSRHAGLAAACEKYARVFNQGQKNSDQSEEALTEMLIALDQLPADLPAGTMKLVSSMKKSAKEEKARVAKVRENVAKAVSGQGAIKFVEASASGDGTTTRVQNEALKKMIAEEAARSNVFAKLLEEVMASPQELEMITGRGSCGLFDSFMEGTVDTTHFGILPAEPVIVNNKKVGLTQGEILVHVLEERLYSRQRVKDDKEGFGKCGDYDHAHNKCLAPGSYQNLYRRERGVASDTLQLTTGKTRDGHSGFQHLSSDGAISTTPTAGINSLDFKPDPGRFEYDAEDRDGYLYVMERYRKTLELKFRNGKLVNADGKFDRSKLEASATKDWKVWLTEQTGNAAKADAVVEGIVTELGARYERHYEEEARRVKAQTRKADKFLNDKADRELSPGSLALRQRRQARGKGHVNDAVAQYRAWQERRGKMSEAQCQEEDKRLPKVTDTSRVNCAVTTLAAITGGDSTECVRNYFELCQRPDLKDNCGGLQGDDMWVFIEEGRVPEPISNDDDRLREALNGDAQLRGVRNAMLAEARKRGPEYKVVQDGLNDHGGMYPPDKLLEQMSKYPDGTQFQVFLNGDMRHWVYAEMFEGQLVIEDYQMSSTEGKGSPPTAKVATEGRPPQPAKDGMPDNPLSGVGGSFTEGMFLAITPVADAKDLPAHATDPSWPEPGTDADAKLSAVIAELAKKALPKEFAATLQGRKADIDPGWCDAERVANAILAADAAFEELKKPRKLSDPPAGAALLFQQHAQAIPQIKAANNQINRLIQARVVSKIRYAPQPVVVFPEEDGLLVEELRKAKGSLAEAKFDADAFTAAYDGCKKFKTANPPGKWTDEQLAQAKDFREKLNSAIEPMDAGAVRGLKDRLRGVVLKLGLELDIKRFEKRKRLTDAVPSADEFVRRLSEDEEAFARLLGRDELSEEEIEKASAERRSVKQDREGLANKTAKDISEEDRRKEAEKLDAREAAVVDDKLLAAKKQEFTKTLKKIAKAVTAVREATARLKLPPAPDNDMKAADAARQKLTGAVAATNDKLLITQLEKTVVDPLTAEIERRRFLAATIPELEEFVGNFGSFIAGMVGTATPKEIKDAFFVLRDLPDRADVNAVKPALKTLVERITNMTKPVPLKRQLVAQLGTLPGELRN